MSSSDRLIAIGVISGFLRAPLLKAWSCLWMYCSPWPASTGHSGFALLPCAPWQAMHAVALDSPFSTDPAASAGLAPRQHSANSGTVTETFFIPELQHRPV